MAIQKDANNKMYLHVDHSRDEGISVIDVTQPAKPKILGFVSWPNRAVASQMNITGRLGIFTERGRRLIGTRILVAWWCRLIRSTFSPRCAAILGVVRWFEDERDFIYVLNGDGLFVISEPAEGQCEQIYSSNFGEK